MEQLSHIKNKDILDIIYKYKTKNKGVLPFNRRQINALKELAQTADINTLYELYSLKNLKINLSIATSDNVTSELLSKLFQTKSEVFFSNIIKKINITKSKALTIDHLLFAIKYTYKYVNSNTIDWSEETADKFFQEIISKDIVNPKFYFIGPSQILEFISENMWLKILNTNNVSSNIIKRFYVNFNWSKVSRNFIESILNNEILFNHYYHYLMKSNNFTDYHFKQCVKSLKDLSSFYIPHNNSIKISANSIKEVLMQDKKEDYIYILRKKDMLSIFIKKANLLDKKEINFIKSHYAYNATTHDNIIFDRIVELKGLTAFK